MEKNYLINIYEGMTLVASYLMDKDEYDAFEPDDYILENYIGYETISVSMCSGYKKYIIINQGNFDAKCVRIYFREKTGFIDCNGQPIYCGDKLSPKDNDGVLYEIHRSFDEAYYLLPLKGRLYMTNIENLAQEILDRFRIVNN